MRQAVTEYEEVHPEPIVQEETVPVLHPDTVSEKSAKVGAVRIYHFHRSGAPAPSSGSRPMQYYRESAAVQIFPKDKTENLLGPLAEKVERNADYYGTYVSVRQGGLPAEEYWSVVDQRTGDRYKVAIPSDDQQRYAILVDFAEHRAVDQAGAQSGHDITIFVG